jgi:hypothetical protein
MVGIKVGARVATDVGLGVGFAKGFIVGLKVVGLHVGAVVVGAAVGGKAAMAAGPPVSELVGVLGCTTCPGLSVRARTLAIGADEQMGVVSLGHGSILTRGGETGNSLVDRKP